MSSSSPKQERRARTKRFTGCWTCRSRKLRCDEGRPSCHQCVSKGIACGGYDARLQWMPPETMDRQSAPVKIAIEPGSRRLLLCESDITVDLNEIDSTYEKIDSLSESECCVSISTLTSGPFGVFPHHVLSKAPSPAPASPPIVMSPTCPAESTPPVSPSSTDLVASSPQESGLEVMDTGLIGASQLVQELNPNFHSKYAVVGPGDENTTENPIEPISSSIGGLCSACHQRSPGYLGEQSPANTAYGLVSVASTPSVFTYLPTTALPEEHKYLLNYYIHKVIRLFCVIDNDDSPWRIIHLPKIMQAAGELSVTGTTSLIRQAFFKAILSASAFILSSEYRHDTSNNDEKKWSTKALYLRQEAIGLLQESVSKEYYSKKKPKYKEFLATMLSMVTIDVMSGDTGSCTVHLDGCEQLIRVSSKSNRSFSSKARALHRIYFYLRIIHGITSSFAERPTTDGLFEPTSPPALSTVSPAARSSDSGHSFQIPSWIPSWLDLSYKTSGERMAFELIYGIPESLFFLLNRSITALRLMEQESTPGSTSNSFISFCENLEVDILDWPKAIEVDRCMKACNNAKSAEIVKYQICAFYNAVVIYFSYCVKQLSHRYLRQYVRNVLESVSAIEEIKASANIIAGPLLFPVFMAASVALDTDFQAQFKLLFDKIESYGFHAARAGHEVIHEIWQRWERDRVHSHWRSVVKEKEVTLMLT